MEEEEPVAASSSSLAVACCKSHGNTSCLLEAEAVPIDDMEMDLLLLYYLLLAVALRSSTNTTK